MKKFILYGLAVLIMLVVLAAVIVPMVYKDVVRSQVIKAANEQLRAEFYFSDFDLSLLRSFPKLTASLHDLSVVNEAPFAGDTLLYVTSFEAGIHLTDLVFRKEINIQQIHLKEPRIQLKVRADGAANFNILPETESSTSTDSSLALSAQIDEWRISNGHFTYDDRQSQTLIKLNRLNHKGSGNVSSTLFDLMLSLDMQIEVLKTSGSTYLQNREFSTSMLLDANTDEMRFNFKEAQLKVNELALGLEGWFALPEGQGYNMDISFAAPKTDFRQVLSLVPGMYTAQFKDIKTEGQFELQGYVRGSYNDALQQIPAYRLRLLIDDARFQYPSLPMPAEQINADLEVDNPSGKSKDLLIDLKKFTLKLGNNPVNGKVRIKGMDAMAINADVNARLNLEELSKVFPIEGTILKGLFELKVQANGNYDQARKIFPKTNAAMSLKNGYVRSVHYPDPIEEITMAATAINNSGNMADTRIDIAPSSFVLDKRPFAVSGNFSNLEDLNYKLDIKGELNLEKLSRIYPVEGTSMGGWINAELQTVGKLSDAQAQRYDRLPTSGSLSLKDFSYKSTELAQPVLIGTGKAYFSPQRMQLSDVEGKLGSSDFIINGEITNYIAWLLSDNAVLRGSFGLDSRKFDLNEWMTDEAASTSANTDTVVMAVKVPVNLDFGFKASFNELQYSTFQLKNAYGRMSVKEGVLYLDNFNFSLLGGTFATKGAYDTRDMKHPLFDFSLQIKDISIPGAYNAFSTVQAFAPIAQVANGLFSSEISLKGELSQSMMPLFQTLNGTGVFNIREAGLRPSPLMEQVGRITSLSVFPGGAQASPQAITQLRDLLLKAEFSNGRMFINPTELRLGGYAATVAGSAGFDGSIDYLLMLNIPKGQVSSQLSQRLDALTGGNQSASDMVQVNLQLKGLYSSPQVALAPGGTKESIKKDLENKLAEEKQAAREIVQETARETVRDAVSNLLGTRRDSLQNDSSAQRPAIAPQERVKDAANKLLDRFRKKPAATQPDTLKNN